MAYRKRQIALPCSNCGRGGCKYCNVMRPFPALPDAHELGVSENFAIVVPKGATNLLTNPTPFLYPNGVSGGVSPTIYFAHGAINTPQILSGYGTHGPFGVYMEPSTVLGSGLTVYNGGVPTTILDAGQTYTFAFDHSAEISSTWEIALMDVTETISYASDTFTATGNWQRISLTFTPQLTQEYTFVIRKIAPNQTFAEWYAAAFQLETGKIATSYFDGFGTFDWPGLKNHNFMGDQKWFEWVGGPPWRAVSRRGAYNRAGGIEVNMADCGFKISGYTGLGMPQVTNISQPYATLDGSYFGGARYESSVFTIRGRFDACSNKELHNMRSCLRDMLIDCTRQYRDHMIIRYTPRDECGAPCGESADIICRYAGGLEGNITSTMEDVTLQFEMFNPFVRAYNQRDYQNVLLAGNGNVGENADVTLKYAVCNRGDTYAQPVFLFFGDFDLSGLSIRNDDTGHTVYFQDATPPEHIDFNGPDGELVIVNTTASASEVVGTIRGNLSGYIEACSNLADFELACGWNHLTIEIKNVTNPPEVADPITQSRPYVRIAWREQFAGIDTFAACSDDDFDCDESEVNDGYTILG